jgi:hypothetical protein
MDIDKQILELEGKTAVMSLGSKALFIKIGLSLVISIIFLYAIRPYYLLSVEADAVEQKCVAKLKMKRFVAVSLIFSVGIYFLIDRMNIFSE